MDSASKRLRRTSPTKTLEPSETIEKASGEATTTPVRKSQRKRQPKKRLAGDELDDNDQDEPIATTSAASKKRHSTRLSTKDAPKKAIDVTKEIEANAQSGTTPDDLAASFSKIRFPKKWRPDSGPSSALAIVEALSPTDSVGASGSKKSQQVAAAEPAEPLVQVGKMFRAAESVRREQHLHAAIGGFHAMMAVHEAKSGRMCSHLESLVSKHSAAVGRYVDEQGAAEQRETIKGNKLTKRRGPISSGMSELRLLRSQTLSKSTVPTRRDDHNMKERCRRAMLSRFMEMFHADGIGHRNDKVSVLGSLVHVMRYLTENHREVAETAMKTTLQRRKTLEESRCVDAGGSKPTRSNAVLEVQFDDSML